MHFKNWLLLEMPMQQGGNLALFVETGFVALFQLGSAWRDAIREQDIDLAANLLYGIMEMRDNTMYHTWEVDAVWAQRGYGPYLYLLGMTLAYPDGLAPTRVKSQIQPAASRVWHEFYQGAGKDYVTPVPLEGATHHDEPYLNYKYVIKRPINIKPMVRRGQVLFRGDKYGEMRDVFNEMLVGFLKAKMSEIY